jgi:hypothetical protein
LAELTRRYFTSHGPAQIADFVWWSGLTTADARRGLEMVGQDLDRDVLDGRPYWFPRRAGTGDIRGATSLLGLYDEYLIAYKDRSAALDRSLSVRMVRDPFGAPIVMDGRVIGGWRRSVKGDRMVVTVTPFAPLARAGASQVEAAAHDYGSFFGCNVELSFAR